MKEKMKSKKLNLQEITKIYHLLKPALDGRELEEVVFDEIDKIIELSSPEALLECLYIIYDNKVEFSSPAEFVDMLIKGLLDIDFYYFVDFIKVLNNDSAR